MEWSFCALGRAAGKLNIGDEYHVYYRHKGEDGRYLDAVHHLSMELDEEKIPDAVIVCEQGKFADSEDSFVFWGFPLDPGAENFRLSARLTVSFDNDGPSSQTAFGLAALDTLSCGDHACRHRNHLLCGCFRTFEGRNFGLGLRAVSGYSDPAAGEQDPVRILDPTRAFSAQPEEDCLRGGETYDLSLEKTDEGFIATLSGNEDETIVLPGCDFLTAQETGRVYAGFAAGGHIRLDISDIKVSVVPGRMSHTPEGTIKQNVPYYPFRPEMIAEPQNRGRYDSQVFASPAGKADSAGTEDDPVDILTAFAGAEDGCEIVLLPGTYQPEQPLYVIAGRDDSKGIAVVSHDPREAVIDGSALKERLPIFILRGERCALDGIVFAGGPSSGLFVCGSGNSINNCEAYGNGDTGILICAFPGSDELPADNTVSCCDSHDNKDIYGNGADGFGAKLRLGSGNRFTQCMAYDNSDDGFDLYAKSIFGPIGAVELEECVAFGNGKGSGKNPGSGFKLGGENQPVEHRAENCLAYDNAGNGFASNMDPCGRFIRCTAIANGKKAFALNTERKDRDPHWITEALCSDDDSVPGTKAGDLNKVFISTDTSVRPRRRESDNRIEMNDLFKPKFFKRGSGARLK